MTETEMVKAVLTEMRAVELLSALRRAVAGAPHWRYEAQTLLQAIDGLVLPTRGIELLRDRDDCKRASEIMDDACHG